MKTNLPKLILLFSMPFLLISCEDGKVNDNKENNSILGKWKFTSLTHFGAERITPAPLDWLPIWEFTNDGYLCKTDKYGSQKIEYSINKGELIMYADLFYGELISDPAVKYKYTIKNNTLTIVYSDFYENEENVIGKIRHATFERIK